MQVDMALNHLKRVGIGYIFQAVALYRIVQFVPRFSSFYSRVGDLVVLLTIFLGV